ncbi:MAG TPA: hypothetical protein VEC12_15710 [Bacteroidia bacterium]|nr:hypothetical protein [Bacteroidia bacterium]
MESLEKTPSTEPNKGKWLSVFITNLVATCLTLLGIYWIGSYGIALFILIPFFIGACSTILYGRGRAITRRAASKIGFLTLGIFTAGLLFFAIEGIICIAMVAPIAVLLTWIGSLAGLAILNKMPDNSTTPLLILVGIIPLTAFAENVQQPELSAVTTSIEIDASPQTVWENVIEFPPLEDPEEFIFKTGIAYPINAKIDGKGVGAVRHCNFTTGSFVEPVTIWDEPHLLKFDVAEWPEPMKELSFWDVDAPHLHDYFVSKTGQFKLTALPNGKTLLEGTTWYSHNIRPAIYWQLWSEYIVHKIHKRVLNHIKVISESTDTKK